jgi:hypothetical protein
MLGKSSAKVLGVVGRMLVSVISLVYTGRGGISWYSASIEPFVSSARSSSDADVEAYVSTEDRGQHFVVGDRSSFAWVLLDDRELAVDRSEDLKRDGVDEVLGAVRVELWVLWELCEL